jgi:hypothetical protein
MFPSPTCFTSLQAVLTFEPCILTGVASKSSGRVLLFFDKVPLDVTGSSASEGSVTL